jgi:NADPH-dependent 2,4-dienoyl-CoA reductase/sulfur reductase-like enzyme
VFLQACFNAKTGDIEDAPALDALPIFDVTERDGAVYLTGEESDIKSSRRKPNFECAGAGDAQKDHVVIVGGGSGALGTIEGLRENGYKGVVTVISNEGYLPIDRPKLSKALLTDEKKLAWRDKAWYDSSSVKWVDGEVNSVDFSGRSVSVKDGDKISYTKLVLATGGTPRRLPMQGISVLENVHTLRTVHDTKKIVESIGDKEEGRSITIIGSSFIGMEVANATAGGKNPVTIIGMEKAPLERVLGELVGLGIQKSLESKGIKFYMGASVDRVEPSGKDTRKIGAVFLKDGTEIQTDVLILGVGVAPATEYLKNNKEVTLEKDGSIKTDENYSIAGLDDVYAIGDIATFPYHGPGGDGNFVRIEHWNVAQQSGRVAAKHIVDSSATAEHFIPVFWSALGAQLRYCGNSSIGWDDLVLQGNPSTAKFVAYYCKGDTVVAMASMGKDPAMSQSAELMRRGKMPSKSKFDEGLDVLSLGAPA